MAAKRAPSLLVLCERAVAENAALYPFQAFYDLPHVLLAGVARWLCPKQLLRLDIVFSQKDINTDENWKVHFEFRWRRYHDTGHAVFLSSGSSPKTIYINKHFQEVFYLAMESRWDEALHVETKMNQYIDKDSCLVYQCLSTADPLIPLRCKQDLASNLDHYSSYINRYSMNCAHAVKLIENPDYLKLLLGIKAIRLIRLTDVNMESTIKFLHHLRTFGSLSEINILTCPLSSKNCAKFLEFCLQKSSDEVCIKNSASSHVDNIVLDVLLGDLGFTFYDNISAQSSVCTLSPPVKKMKASSGSSDAKKQSSSSCQYAESYNSCPDEDQLYDTALMEPLSGQEKCNQPTEPDPDETREIFNNVKGAVIEPSTYSQICQLSIDDNAHNISMTSIFLRLFLPRWTHLTALAIEGLSNHVETNTACLLYQRIKDLFEYPCFREFHVADSSNLCILLALVTAKRESALSCLKMDSDRVSAGICSCVEASQHLPDWSTANFVKRLELVFCTGHLYIDILQKVIMYDKALSHLILMYTAFRLSPGDLDIGHILTSLRVREDAGIPGLHTLDLSKTCLISTFQDYLMGSLSPVKLASLSSLNLSCCNLHLMEGLKTVFTNDIVSHPNLRELNLSSNSLEKTGCILLMRICSTIIEGSSKVKVLDMSDNKITADDLLPVAERVNAMTAERQHGGDHRRQYFGRCLLLNGNYLGAEYKEIQTLFASLFLKCVEVKVAKYTFDAEHLSQM